MLSGKTRRFCFKSKFIYLFSLRYGKKVHPVMGSI